MRLIPLLVLAALMATLTWAVGWWTIPVLAALYALVTRHRRAARVAAMAALLAWGGLLVSAMTAPSFTTLLRQLGQIFPAPGPAVAALTLLLGMILAATAARVMIGLTGTRDAAG